MPDAESHAHHWMMQKYEFGISKGVCACGAEKYFSDIPEMVFLLRAGDLNKREGKIKMESAKQVPGIPPRPDISAMNRHDKALAMRNYYDQHKALIVKDLQGQGGLRQTRKRWAISHTTMRGLLKRWEFAIHGDTVVYNPSKSDKPIEADPEKAIEISPKAQTVESQYSRGLDKPRDGSPPGIMVQVSIHTSLPDLPPFNESWPDDIKMVWLKNYGELARQKVPA